MTDFQMIWISSRRVTIELLGEDLYETKPYRAVINGTEAGTFCKMVSTITGLVPDTDYDIFLEDEQGRTEIRHFHTKAEKITLNVRQFGANGDGKTDDTASLQAAILCCPPNGRVLIPQGKYCVTSLFLKSDITIEIEKDAFLLGIYDRNRIPVLPGETEYEAEDGYYNLGSWEGNPLDCFAALLTGIHVENVSVCGEGILDGRADFDGWWKDVSVKKKAWRPRMIFLNGCRNITVQGITVQNSPAWNLHPYFCEQVRFLDMKVLGPSNSHNTDGCDPESCRGVDIVGVFFSVGDDCIAVKSGKIYMGKKYKRPCEQISIRHCMMKDGHGAVTLGSEIAGGVSCLSVSKCLFSHTDRGLRVKTRRGRGKDCCLNEILFEEIRMEGVKAPFVVNSFYFCDPDGKTDYVRNPEALPVDDRTPRIGKMTFQKIFCTDTHFCAAYICGLPEQKIEQIRFSDITVRYAENAQTGQAAMMEDCRPGCRQGMILKNIHEVILEGVCVEGQDGEKYVCSGVDIQKRVDRMEKKVDNK